MSQYSTNGITVTDKAGGCMGIFSTVALLNDKVAQLGKANQTIRILVEALKKIEAGGVNNNYIIMEAIARSALKETGYDK